MNNIIDKITKKIFCDQDFMCYFLELMTGFDIKIDSASENFIINGKLVNYGPKQSIENLNRPVMKDLANIHNIVPENEVLLVLIEQMIISNSSDFLRTSMPLEHYFKNAFLLFPFHKYELM